MGPRFNGGFGERCNPFRMVGPLAIVVSRRLSRSRRLLGQLQWRVLRIGWPLLFHAIELWEEMENFTGIDGV